MTRKNIIRLFFSVVTFCGIFLYLWLQCPQYLLYHEQNQLFLFTGTYFARTVFIPGGLADYISEFIVQFYYVPIYGALLTALVLTLCQVFLGLACRKCDLPITAYTFSALPSVLYLGAMGDENILLSFAVAMLMTTFSLYLISLCTIRGSFTSILIIVFGFIVLYCLVGAFAVVFVLAGGILFRRPTAIAVGLPVAFIVIWAIHCLWFEQYPLSRMLSGINYYRVPEFYSPVLFIIAAVTVIVPLVTTIKIRSTTFEYVSAVAVCLFAVIYVPSCFNNEKSRLLTYDSLVRQGRWADIISKVNTEKPSDFFSLQALNLALGMTGQLPESMFHYNQKGIEGLIGRDRLDNTTQLITAEALYQLGLTNIAFSTTFDLQEAIMNDRKSGRLMKRMAECMLIKGNYETAAKYIKILSHSLYYAPWAREAETLLGNDKAVEAHPLYGRLRRNGFKKEGFYDYSQLDKILAMLAVDSNGSNSLAWQYFCAAALLNRNLETLVGVYNYYAGQTGPHRIPLHVQEAIAMYWTFSHQTFEGIPFPVSEEVQRRTATLAKVVMKNKNNPAAWQTAAPDSYGIYFLSNSHLPSAASTPSSASNADYQPTHE